MAGVPGEGEAGAEEEGVWGGDCRGGGLPEGAEVEEGGDLEAGIAFAVFLEGDLVSKCEGEAAVGAEEAAGVAAQGLVAAEGELLGGGQGAGCPLPVEGGGEGLFFGELVDALDLAGPGKEGVGGAVGGVFG